MKESCPPWRSNLPNSVAVDPIAFRYCHCCGEIMSPGYRVVRFQDQDRAATNRITGGKKVALPGTVPGVVNRVAWRIPINSEQMVGVEARREGEDGQSVGTFVSGRRLYRHERSCGHPTSLPA